MRRSLLIVTFAVLLAGCQGSATKNKPSLLGKWQGVAVENYHGSNLPDHIATACTYTFTNDKILIGERGKTNVEFTYTINSTKTPNEIDMITPDYEKDGKVLMKGIYKIDINTLLICQSLPENDRPTEFKPTKECKSQLLTFKRVIP
ncbi:hypothetical protein AYO44_06735 [Planctomycetaceae bacterium SCGC AG-212-F19]|nr:hypothetical protein AYO44_06735 [Planctomycetaceae bacterium SCGC AG-212-F19]